TPDAVAEYAKTARERGLRVLICGAGLAAALPGAVAAHTDLPVIGVPLRSSLSVLDGLDALLAIAQMPPGVPVAAVGVDNAKEAAALTARVRTFFTQEGVTAGELTATPVAALAPGDIDDEGNPISDYRLTRSFQLRSNRVGAIAAIAERSARLLADGVPLAAD